MTAEAFNRWLAEMKQRRKDTRSDADCARLLGVSANTVVTMKREGVRGAAAVRTALACQALLLHQEPYG